MEWLHLYIKTSTDEILKIESHQKRRFKDGSASKLKNKE